MRRSIATVSLSGALEDKLAAAASAGFDGIELFEPDLIACPQSPDELRGRLAELGLELSLYQPFRDLEGVSPRRLAANLRRAERKLAVMEKLGARMMLVCSSVDEDAIDDDALMAEQLGLLADLAAGYGVRVAYEALAWGRHVAGFERSWRVVERADHLNLGVCLDSFHILARGDDPSHIAEIPGAKIFYVQLADAPKLGMDVLQWSRHHRCLPGQGGFDLASFVAHVLAAGYEGPLSLEVFNDVLRQTDPVRTAVDAMRSLIGLEDAVAKRALGPDAATLGHKELPPPAALAGYAFVELAVDPVSEASVQRLLTALGFHQAGLHRSKPVELWGNGEARVVLNRGRRRPGERGNGVAEVSTVAVESSEPERALCRSERLLAPRLVRKRGPRETDLAAIEAPDGTSVFICRTADGGPRWQDDFISLDLAGDGAGTLLCIDHVALSVSLESFDETVLFHRAVLGLEPDSSQELAGPRGLIRSRALRSHGSGVRIVLNVPLLAGGALHPADLQHVAFACPDIFVAAEGLRRHGVPALPIPDNYYDDLTARLELDDDLVKSMRDLAICYDRDSDGELLHFYTPLAGTRVFFEVVERRGAYSGYGAANSVVRMAAQHGALQALGVA